MKKYLFLMIGAASLFSACNNSGTGTSAETKTDSSGSVEQQNMMKNRSVYKAIETGDSATIHNLIADDAVDHQGPKGTEVKGGAEITHMLTDIHNHVKDLKFDVISDAAKGDYIFSMVQMSGTMTDNAWGMPAGTKMNSKSVDVIRVKNGKMVEHWGFLDPRDMQQAGSNMPMDSTGKKK